MTYSRPTPIPDPLPNLESTATDPAFYTQDPAVYKDGKVQNTAILTTFRKWKLSDIVKAVQNAIGLSQAGYISTTNSAIQAKVGDKFQIDKTGNILLPTSAKDGTSTLVVDPYLKLQYLTNKVIAEDGQTIGKGQVPADTLSKEFSLQNDEGVLRIEFIYSSTEANWAVLLDGKMASESTSTPPYVFTTTADLSIGFNAMVEIDKAGNVLLWEPKMPGEFATFTDGRGLLATLDVFVVAPDGHTIGKGQIPDDALSKSLNLKNSNGAQWIRLTYDGDKNWIINTVTKNG